MWQRRISAFALTLCFGVTGLASEALALRILDRKSPKNRSRPLRARTDFIVLHTTEGAPKGALAKLRRNGEAHYLVNRDGTVYRIVDKDRVAFHAGRSMWNGVANLDRRSVGIEVVGYHHREIGARQRGALKELIRQLRQIYSVPADRVLTHAQVAYGRPNRYHRYDHRGRKRCAMNLGTPKMRKLLGLEAGPARDPDVDAGRLRVADRPLFSRLFPQVRLTSRGRPARRGHRHTPEPAKTRRLRVEKAAPALAAKVSVKSADKARLIAPAAAAEVLDLAVDRLTALVERAESRAKAHEEAPASDPSVAPQTPREAPASVASARSKTSRPAPSVKAPSKPRPGDEAPRLRLAKTAPKPATPARIKTKPTSAKRQRAPRGAPVVRETRLCRVSRRSAPARVVAGPKFAASTTIYLLPDGRVRTGADLSKRQARLLEALPKGTRVLAKKTFGGYVKASRAPSEICGARWRSEDTVYRFPSGKLVAGPQIDPARLPKATMIFCAS